MNVLILILSILVEEFIYKFNPYRTNVENRVSS